MSEESEDILEDAEELRQEIFDCLVDYQMRSIEISLAAVITEIVLINGWDVEDIRDYFRIIWKNAEKIKIGEKRND